MGIDDPYDYLFAVYQWVGLPEQGWDCDRKYAEFSPVVISRTVLNNATTYLTMLARKSTYRCGARATAKSSVALATLLTPK